MAKPINVAPTFAAQTSRDKNLVETVSLRLNAYMKNKDVYEKIKQLAI